MLKKNISKFFNFIADLKFLFSVFLTEDAAREQLGDPNAVKGYTTQGSAEEWAAIADCYFEALNQYAC